MIGARDVAFPRLNAWSYWMFLFGGIALYASFFWMPPEAGWSPTCRSRPRSSAERRSGRVDFMADLRPVVDARRGQLHCDDPQHARAGWAGAGCVVRLDDPDLSYLIVLAISSLAATVTMLLTDRNFGTHSSIRPKAGSALLWQHLFWFFGHPEVYIFVLPAFGVFSEVIRISSCSAPAW